MDAVQQFIEALGAENLATMSSDDAVRFGLSAADTATLVDIGLPVEAGPLFTIDVVGEPGMLDVHPMTTADGEENFAVFIGGPRDRPELRYFLDVRNGFVVVCSVDDANPVSEVINGSLAVFVEFLLRFAVYYEKESATVEDDVRSLEELAVLLREQDPYAVRSSGTWWSKILGRLQLAAVGEN